MLKGLMVILLSFGCHPSSHDVESTDRGAPTTEGSHASIAAVEANDVATHERITQLLAANGIDALIEGSVVYGVLVAQSDASEATRLLRADASAGNYWIRFSGRPSDRR